MINAGTTEGRQVLIETDLPRLMDELNQVRHTVIDIKRRKHSLSAQLDDYRRTGLVMAQQSLEIEKSRLVIEINEATDPQTGKARYSNETTRGAALVQQMAKDADYQEALTTLGAAEAHVARISLDLQEIEDDIKTRQDLIWTLRTLVDGARSMVMALATFDGPKIPSEIVHRIPEMQIQLRAPESMPTITVAPKEAA